MPHVCPFSLPLWPVNMEYDKSTHDARCFTVLKEQGVCNPGFLMSTPHFASSDLSWPCELKQVVNGSPFQDVYSMVFRIFLMMRGRLLLSKQQPYVLCLVFVIRCVKTACLQYVCVSPNSGQRTGSEML